jgi:hypothetical protein
MTDILWSGWLHLPSFITRWNFFTRWLSLTAWGSLFTIIKTITLPCTSFSPSSLQNSDDCISILAPFSLGPRKSIVWTQMYRCFHHPFYPRTETDTVSKITAFYIKWTGSRLYPIEDYSSGAVETLVECITWESLNSWMNWVMGSDSKNCTLQSAVFNSPNAVVIVSKNKAC